MTPASGRRGFAASGGLVAISGLAVTILAWKTYVVPERIPTYTFQRASWIAAPDCGPVAYFRKELSLAEPVRSAWIVFAAIDTEHTLYVNNHLIDRQTTPLPHDAEVFEISHFLQQGRNVVALRLVRSTHLGPAQVLIEGAIRGWSGHQQDFQSDSTWTAAAREETQGQGTISWHSVSLVSTTPPKLLSGPTRFETTLAVFPNAVLEPAPAGAMAAAGGGATASFRTMFDVGADPVGAFVRIAADEGYLVTVNGTVVAEGPRSEDTLEIQDVSPYVSRGANSIVVRVTSRSSPPRLTADVLLDHGDRIDVIANPERGWTVEEPSGHETEPLRLLGSPLAPATRPLGSPAALPQRMIPPRPPPEWAAAEAGRLLLLGLVILTLAVADWLIISRIIQFLRPAWELAEARRLDAILHLPSLLIVVGLLLMRLDTRLIFQTRTLVATVAVLYALRGVLVVELTLWGRPFPDRPPGSPRRGHRGLALVAALVLGATSATLRARQVGLRSLQHDEVSMAVGAEEVLARGVPVRVIGAFDKPLTTYELVPYPIALAMYLFGESDSAVRSPAVLFGTLTTVLILLAGRRLWGIWTGILAATIHAFSPMAIAWGTNAFHPQQAQLLALATCLLFFEAAPAPGPVTRPALLYVAAAAMVATYLTWEGAGIVLVALLAAKLVASYGDQRWITSRHVWQATGLVAIAVALQLGRRILVNVPYIVVGSGLSDAVVHLSLLDPSYDPWFYVSNYLLDDNQRGLTVALLVGLPLTWRDRAVRYWVVLLAALVILLTNILPNVSTRYAYFTQPFLILPASAVTSLALARLTSGRAQPWVVVATRRLVIAGLSLTLFFSSNSILQGQRNRGPGGEVTQPEPDIYGIDYRGAARLVAGNRRPSDIVIALRPHAFAFYARQEADYCLQTYTNRAVYYDVSRAWPGYLDKFAGRPVLRSLSELHDVLYRHPRTWILALPERAFERSVDPATLDFLETRARLVFERPNARVYLWDRHGP